MQTFLLLSTLTNMRAWIYDGLEGDQRAPHDSGIAVELSVLEGLGLLPRPAIKMEQVELIAAERSYKNRDVISVSKEGLGDLYEEKLKGFFRFVIEFGIPDWRDWTDYDALDVESICMRTRRLGGSLKEEDTLTFEVITFSLCPRSHPTFLHLPSLSLLQLMKDH